MRAHSDFGSSGSGLWPEPNQGDVNGAECALVDWLIATASTRLTDRGGARHAPPWDPKQHVRIGVLRPNVQPEQSEDAAAEEAQEEASSARLATSNEPVAIGLDFTVDPNVAREIELTTTIQFAVYQPLLPTFDEISRHVREQAVMLAGGSTGPAGTATSGGPTRIPVPHAWQRTDVVLEELALKVPLDGSHVGHDLQAQIESIVTGLIQSHFARDDAARPFTQARTVAVSALDAEQTWRDAIDERIDREWDPLRIPLIPRVEAFAEALPDGRLLVSVSLVNDTSTTPGAFQDHTMYDCRLQVRLQSGSLVRQRFNLAPDDYRYFAESDVVGHGRNCVAVESDGGIKSDTLPRYVQRVIRPREDHIPGLEWATLAVEPASVLLAVEQAMSAYLDEWDQFLAANVSNPEVHAASSLEREAFREELDRFALGRSLVTVGDPDCDGHLERAFRLANRSFGEANAERNHNAWRLFQLVYIVSQLPALAARTHPEDARFRSELDYADVLWFPTGGGKTEAYLGLIVTAAFYDRLRGKGRGVTAWLKFPLRMLSVQQLARVLRILVVADEVRQKEVEDPGAPFELGYLVGSGNTPNTLLYQDRWWPGIDNADQLDEVERKRRRLIAACPFCGSKDGVALAPNKDDVRLFHECGDCGRGLPIYMSDDEVYRYQPTVIVSTIDKITGYAHFGDFTSFTHGPARECPDHGYFNFGKCLAGNQCSRAPREMRAVEHWVDPVPSLVVQDELHLVREELGTFDAHMEGLITELQTGGPSGVPSKILAATATIEQYEDQLQQVYGRHPRRFPSPGFERTRGFYTIEVPDIRRVFLGVMPTGGGMSKVEASSLVQTHLARAVTYLQDNLETARVVISDRSNLMLSDEAIVNLLFNYEASLSYVNNRGHGAMIADDLRGLSRELEHATNDSLQFQILTGDVPIAELAAAIDRIEDATLEAPRGSRLRALVGTSVVSHGVDLSRLNVMVMCGMPSTIADYIQATSRSGRTHVGLVVSVSDHFARREASFFVHFNSTHRFLERTVEPVPVNKYARHAVDRTLPAIVMALLWDLARNPDKNGPPEGIRLTRHFQRWWNSRAADLDPLLRQRLDRAYRTPITGIGDPGLEQQLVDRALERWENVERPQMSMFDADKTKELFRERVLASLRDVDEAVEFGAMPNSQRVYESLI